MKIFLKSLLSKTTSYREALIKGSSNIKPRFTLSNSQGFGRLKIFSKVVPATLLIFSLLGYQPAFAFPPIKKGFVFAEEVQTQEVLAQAIPEFQLPFQGYVSNKFTWYHPGIDIAAGFGTPIHPIAEGVISEINLGYFGYGNHVIVDHQDGFKSLYGHMDKVYAQKNQKVALYDTLGTVGLTGFTSGPHTHLEILKDGKNINPESILPKIDGFPKDEYLTPYGGKSNYPEISSPNPQAQKLTKTLKLDL